MNRPALISIAALALAVGVGTAAVFASGLVSSPDRADVQVGAQPTPVVTATEPLADQTSAPAAVPTTPTDAATPSATPTPTDTETASSDVAHVQQRLTDLGYYVGAIDGVAGPATASAVQAFQKVQRLTADGVIGPNTVAALDSPTVPELRGGPADRVEVDLDRQVLYLVQDGALARILPISSGSGETYRDPGGGTATSLTPVGDFRVERHISGVRNAPLGTLYDPMYFHSGWAIHGSNSVPAYPASHGCVRVTRADARWLFDRVPIGMAVSVYGNTNAFSPSLGESAGTDTPAGDTAETTPDDGIQTEEPAPPPGPTTPGPTTPGPTTPAPTTPEPTTPAPTTPAPTTPAPTTPAPTTPEPTTPAPTSEPPSSDPTTPVADPPDPQTRPETDAAPDQPAGDGG